jgi:hypothetical protein
MTLLLLLNRLYCFCCRHQWIRDRRPDGQLGQRCLKCMRQREHDLARLIRWQPEHYIPIYPSRQPDFPPPLADPRAARS